MDALEIYCCKRDFQVMGARTNQSAIAEEEKLWLQTLRYCGYISRRDSDNSERLVLYGKVEGMIVEDGSTR